MLTLAAAEFCRGFVRQGLLLYFTEFLGQVHGVRISLAGAAFVARLWHARPRGG
jgi:hypothetical protein